MRGIYWKLYQLQYKEQEIEPGRELARNSYKPPKPPNYAFRKFGGLKVRQSSPYCIMFFFSFWRSRCICR